MVFTSENEQVFPLVCTHFLHNLPVFLGMCTMDPKGTSGKTFALPTFCCGPTGKEALPKKLASAFGIRAVSNWSVFPWVRFNILMWVNGKLPSKMCVWNALPADFGCFLVQELPVKLRDTLQVISEHSKPKPICFRMHWGRESCTESGGLGCTGEVGCLTELMKGW